MIGQVLRQSVSSEEAVHLPQGVELPVRTMNEVVELERHMSDAGDVRSNVVGVLNLTYLFERKIPCLP